MMKIWTLIVCVLSIILIFTYSIICKYQFNRDCGGYLKLAGDAPSPEIAKEYLEIAADYIQRNGLTEGNTGIIFKTPDSDLSFWSKNIFGALETVRSIVSDSNSTQLTKDNALMKVREVVLDNGSDGTEITVPLWITIYPNQAILISIIIYSLIIGIISLFAIVMGD